MQQGFIDIINEYIKTGMVVAEVGVLHGGSAIPGSKIVNSVGGTYIAIDWFLGSKGDGVFADNFIDFFKQKLYDENCLNFVNIIPKSSEEASIEIEDNLLDICFIDADHCYDSVKNDIINYTPKIKNGGILCGHDLESNYYHLLEKVPEEEFYKAVCSFGFHAGVMKAVDEIIGIDNVRIHESTVWSIVVNEEIKQKINNFKC